MQAYASKTMLQKIWEQHEVVAETADTPAVLYVDRHLIHEVTSPQAFTTLRAARPVAAPTGSDLRDHRS